VGHSRSLDRRVVVGYRVAMRLHISLDDALVRELDRRVGPRDRSHFIGKAVRHALDELDRIDALEAALGSIPDAGHEWDDDPAEWVRRQRTDRPVAG
jgi:Arc/MetJ family transcription regulator